MLNVSERTRLGLQKEMCIPYSYLSSMEKLEGREVPALDDESWLSMRDGSSMITEEEHRAISVEVEKNGWWPTLSQYLKNVSTAELK